MKVQVTLIPQKDFPCRLSLVLARSPDFFKDFNQVQMHKQALSFSASSSKLLFFLHRLSYSNLPGCWVTATALATGGRLRGGRGGGGK